MAEVYSAVDRIFESFSERCKFRDESCRDLLNVMICKVRAAHFGEDYAICKSNDCPRITTNKTLKPSL